MLLKRRSAECPALHCNSFDKDTEKREYSSSSRLQLSLSRMSSGALFPSLVPGSRGSSSKYLVEFRAGKMSLKGSTVTPDKRKGLVYIQQTDDSLIHFCWKDRTSGNVEDVSMGLCYAGGAKEGSQRQSRMRMLLWLCRLVSPNLSAPQNREGLGRRAEISGKLKVTLFLFPLLCFAGFDYFP